MTIEEIIIQIFCHVDDQMKTVKKVPLAKLLGFDTFDSLNTLSSTSNL